MGKNNLQDFIIHHEVWAAIITMVVQIVFIYLRTINVAAIADRKLWISIFSGVGIGLSWMISTSLSVTSVIEFKLLPIIAHLVGGVLGTYWGFLTAGNKDSAKQKQP